MESSAVPSDSAASASERDEARVWTYFAADYDGAVRPLQPTYATVNERLPADLRGCTRVLELSAGTGQFTLTIARALAEHGGSGASLLATDLCADMVAKLRERVAGDAHAAVVAVRPMSAYAIDAPADCFDAVVMGNALHIVAEPRRCLAEIRRVLRPGGVLIAPTFCHGTDIFRRALSVIVSLFTPFVAHNRFTLETLCALIAAEGFEQRRAELIGGIWPEAYVVFAKPDAAAASGADGTAVNDNNIIDNVIDIDIGNATR